MVAICSRRRCARTRAAPSAGQRREELLGEAAAPRVTTTWIVAANLSEVQPDKLRRLETWLVNAAPGEGEPRVAVLIDFAPASGGAFGFPFEPGEPINGEVVFYPSLAPLRGLLATTKPVDGATLAGEAGKPSIAWTSVIGAAMLPGKRYQK
jgi:hypothetical protein